MKKMNVFHAKPLQESIFAVRYKINSKGITGEKRKASCFTGNFFYFLLLNFSFIKRLKHQTVLRKYAFFFLILAGCGTQRQSTTETDALIANLRSHVEYLASDRLEGRRTGTAGEKLAAEYISNAFAKAGLQPKGTDGFYQSFSVAEGKEMTAANALSINNTELQAGKDFFPFVYSANAEIDALASVALMESGEPWFFDLAETMNKNSSNPHFDANEAIIAKATDVAKKGAKALFVFNSSNQNDGLSFKGREVRQALSIPVIYVTKDAAKKYLSDPSALLKVKAKTEITDRKRNGMNVVGFVDNGAATTIILGAHFDHLGYGEDQNSRHTGSDKQIHNGADDNASGTAALVELGRQLKASNLKKNNYLLIAFSGEELGLYGSKYFTQNPTVDLSTVNFMINMDMVGRLSDPAKTLTVGGYGTSPTWGELYSRQGKEALYPAATYRFDSSGTGPSDHTSFYLKNIPVLFYFTGLHTDYHKPSDDFDKINYRGQAAIVQHIYSLLQATDKLPSRLAFAKTREAQTTTTARFSVTLGIMPDYTFSGAGVRADGVSEGKPAQKAGLKAGDIITAIGDYKISSMESYMQTLGRFKKGDKATEAYTRNGQSLATTVEF
ncbi:MAG TPA: M20/M25/M40 family metallo-hydrolase [Flavisolibacter sp.]|nr:M20/M25/M40 family metallo-hydrolase [Flavisolibacter sp.]